MLSAAALEHLNCLPQGAKRTATGAHCSSPPSYKYLNSGGIAGRAGAVKAMLRAALALPRPLILNKDWRVEDDQVALTRVWHSRNLSIALDYGANLFWSLSGIQPGALRYREAEESVASGEARSSGRHGTRRIVHAAWAPAKAACFVHASGSCHLTSDVVRRDPMLQSICGLRRGMRINRKSAPPEL